MVKRKKKVVDLSSLDMTKASNEGTEIELVHPVTNEKIDVFVSIIGTDSDEYQKKSRASRNKRLQALTNRKKLDMNADDLDKEGMDLLVACTTGWRNLLVDGVELDFSEANCKKVYTRFAWIKDQVDAHVADRSNFLS